MTTAVKAERARLDWTLALLDMEEDDAIIEIKQMMLDAMDVVEQGGIDTALTHALETFESSLKKQGF